MHDPESTSTSVDPDESDEAVQHPLITLGSVNSQTKEDSVLWPQLTRHTSKPLCKNILACNTLRTLLPMLGGEILDRNHGRHSGFTCIGTNSAVQIGMWKFTTGNRETSQLDRKSCSSWFCMPLKNVKQVAWMHRGKPDLAWDAASMVYGQFHHFLRVSLPKWKDGDREHLLGRCTLYEELEVNPHSKVVSIGTRAKLKWKDKEGAEHDVKYVHLNSIETQIALAPRLEGWKMVGAPGARAQGRITVVPEQFCVMPLFK